MYDVAKSQQLNWKSAQTRSVRPKELTKRGISATFSKRKRNLLATDGFRSGQHNTFRCHLAGESGGQQARTNAGKKAVSTEAAFFVPINC